MKKRGIVASSALLVLIAGTVVLSGIGFLLHHPLTGPGVPPVTGTNTIALPFFQAVGLVTAADLAADINATVANSVISVQRYDKAVNGLHSYSTSGFHPTGFTLTPGECYRVTVNTDVDYIIVGSHNSGLVINLTGPGLPPVTGTNTYAYPYHSLAANAAELTAEVNSAVPDSVVSIQHYDKAANGLISYSPSGTHPTGFNLVPGECYRITVNAPVSFIPSHL